MSEGRFAARRFLILVGAMVAVATLARAQTPPASETATQFYLKYRAAFDKAKSFDDILPFMSAKGKKEVTDKKPDDRKKMFGFIKMMSTVTDLKILKEEKTAEGATITAEGIDFEKKKTKGTIKLIKENGAWKLLEEAWSS